MTDTRRIGISIPVFNRDDMLFASFEKVYDDPRIERITIVDDESDWAIYESIKEKCDKLQKVSLIRNASNQDCYRNKYTSLCYSVPLWNILLDSDNVIDTSYLDRLFEIPEWDNDTIYTPAWAMPHFDFRQFEGLTITKENVASLISVGNFETLLNAANYFVNRDNYIKIFDPNTDPVTSDSIYIAYRWLQSGRRINVVPNLFYDHTVHFGSHYQTQNKRTPIGFHESVLQKLKQLK